MMQINLISLYLTRIILKLNFHSYTVLYLQTTENKQKPNAMEFFIATHTNKDGELDEGAQKVVVSLPIIK